MYSLASFNGTAPGPAHPAPRDKLGAFNQRIALRYTVPGSTGFETADYLTHNLTLVGRSDQPFFDDAATLIHQTMRGLPRAVNNPETITTTR
jgi:type II secretory pathway predicted ATPase ExeA